MKERPVFMFYNHGGSGNRGCEAIVRSTSALLKSYFPSACVRLCSHAPEQDAALLSSGDVDQICSHGVKPLSYDRFVNSLASRLGASREWQIARNNMPFLRRARGADICFSVGGDTYCYKRPELLYAVNKRLKRQGTKTVLWGCSVEPDLLAGELLEDLHTYDLIVARESISFEAMKKRGLPVAYFPDPAFTLSYAPFKLPSGFVPGKTQGLNVSPLILQNASDEKSALNAFITLARHMLREEDATLLLIPHVTWAHDDDRQALRAIRQAMPAEKRLLTLPEGLDAQQIKYAISQLSVLVTARTHASVAAYSTGVPTLVIGYSVKARGIARDLYGKEAEHVISVKELKEEAQLLGAYDALVKRKETERAFLQGRLPAYIHGQNELFSRLEELMR